MATSFAYRILVVDDDETVLETTAAILKNAGYSVNTARDGFEALANLREGVPELLISDLHMPAMSGFELLGVVRKRFPSVIVVATSGQYTPASLPEGVLADRFIPKGDMPPIELLEIVRELIADGPSRPQPARAEIAPAWLPRSTRGYVVLTCPDCLRSFSVPSKDVQVGHRASEPCMYCGKEVHYYLDESVLQEPPTTLDRMLERVETSKKTMASSRDTIDQSRHRITRQSKRKKA